MIRGVGRVQDLPGYLFGSRPFSTVIENDSDAGDAGVLLGSATMLPAKVGRGLECALRPAVVRPEVGDGSERPVGIDDRVDVPELHPDPQPFARRLETFVPKARQPEHKPFERQRPRHERGAVRPACLEKSTIGLAE